MLDQPAVCRSIDDHGHEAVLQGIAAEDVGDGGAHDGANAEVEQGPWRVLARRTATEVVTPPTSTEAPRLSGLFSTKSVRSLPSFAYRQSANRLRPRPSFVVVVRNRAGMI